MHRTPLTKMNMGSNGICNHALRLSHTAESPGVACLTEYKCTMLTQIKKVMLTRLVLIIPCFCTEPKLGTVLAVSIKYVVL